MQFCSRDLPKLDAARLDASVRCSRACATRAVPAEQPLSKRTAVLGALALGGMTACEQPAEASQAQTCFMDMSVEGEVVGRVAIGLLDPGSLAARRFSDLCKGIQGVSYKRSKFDAIFAVWTSAVLHSAISWLPELLHRCCPCFRHHFERASVLLRNLSNIPGLMDCMLGSG